MSRGLEYLNPLDRYTVASQRAAGQIIAAYSTSFGAATKLLGRRHRRHVRNIYALVRIADELVDGVAAAAHLPLAEQHAQLDELEAETERAMSLGYSSNAIVHAFAFTARRTGIDSSLTRPFFASMRMDLAQPASIAGASSAVRRFDESEHADYVYGSAEVVGLMCLRVFMQDEEYTGEQRKILERGARSLGAAFQNVNFLRDLGDDTERLERSYLAADMEMTTELKEQWIATIREQLADAAATLPLLTRDARVAVACALRLFARLTDRLAKVPAHKLHERRVRVSDPEKLLLILRSVRDVRGKRTV
ncbi:squalene/phytoene synthase family protein [Actinomycetaceae bacterium L2_0104]